MIPQIDPNIAKKIWYDFAIEDLKKEETAIGVLQNKIDYFFDINYDILNKNLTNKINNLFNKNKIFTVDNIYGGNFIIYLEYNFKKSIIKNKKINLKYYNSNNNLVSKSCVILNKKLNIIPIYFPLSAEIVEISPASNLRRFFGFGGACFILKKLEIHKIQHKNTMNVSGVDGKFFFRRGQFDNFDIEIGIEKDNCELSIESHEYNKNGNSKKVLIKKLNKYFSMNISREAVYFSITYLNNKNKFDIFLRNNKKINIYGKNLIIDLCKKSNNNELLETLCSEFDRTGFWRGCVDGPQFETDDAVSITKKISPDMEGIVLKTKFICEGDYKRNAALISYLFHDECGQLLQSVDPKIKWSDAVGYFHYIPNTQRELTYYSEITLPPKTAYCTAFLVPWGVKKVSVDQNVYFDSPANISFVISREIHDLYRVADVGNRVVFYDSENEAVTVSINEAEYIDFYKYGMLEYYLENTVGLSSWDGVGSRVLSPDMARLSRVVSNAKCAGLVAKINISREINAADISKNFLNAFDEILFH